MEEEKRVNETRKRREEKKGEKMRKGREGKGMKER